MAAQRKWYLENCFECARKKNPLFLFKANVIFVRRLRSSSVFSSAVDHQNESQNFVSLLSIQKKLLFNLFCVLINPSFSDVVFDFSCKTFRFPNLTFCLVRWWHKVLATFPLHGLKWIFAASEWVLWKIYYANAERKRTDTHTPAWERNSVE